MAWQQDQNADDIVRSVVAGQQRRAINRARGTDERCLLYPPKADIAQHGGNLR